MSLKKADRMKLCRCEHPYDNHEFRYDAKRRNYRFTRDGKCTLCDCAKFVGQFNPGDTRALFKKGDRVVLDDKKRHPEKLTGTVVGYGNEFDLLRIRLDGNRRKTPETWRSWGWEIVPTGKPEVSG